MIDHYFDVSNFIHGLERNGHTAEIVSFDAAPTEEEIEQLVAMTLVDVSARMRGAQVKTRVSGPLPVLLQPRGQYPAQLSFC